MKVEFYGHVRQYNNIKSEIDANMAAVIQSGQFVTGPMLKQFEGEFAAYSGTNHANTFFATAEAIWVAGATAVLVDCDPKTKCIDPAKIQAAITPKTKAIIPVHLYGQCADMNAIAAIARKHKL